MADMESLEREKFLLERARLKFERQKLALEVALRRREACTPKAGWLKDLVANPLVLAIVGGFITLMTGILTGAHTASQNREAEALRAKTQNHQ